MDPTANLLEQERILTSGRPNLRRLSELRNALTEWLSRGGFAPDWTMAPNASRYYGE